MFSILMSSCSLHMRRSHLPIVCSSRIPDPELLRGTITQILFTSKPSLSMRTDTTTLGFICLSREKTLCLTLSRSSSDIFHFLFEWIDSYSSSLYHALIKNCSTKGTTRVSSHITSILGCLFGDIFRCFNSSGFHFNYAPLVP